MLDIGFLHHLEELPRICAQRFHIAPLPFGIDSIKSERAFPRAGQAGYHDQAIPRQVDIDTFEVVLPRTANRNFG